MAEKPLSDDYFSELAGCISVEDKIKAGYNLTDLPMQLPKPVSIEKLQGDLEGEVIPIPSNFHEGGMFNDEQERKIYEEVPQILPPRRLITDVEHKIIGFLETSKDSSLIKDAPKENDPLISQPQTISKSVETIPLGGNVQPQPQPQPPYISAMTSLPEESQKKIESHESSTPAVISIPSETKTETCKSMSQDPIEGHNTITISPESSLPSIKTSTSAQQLTSTSASTSAVIIERRTEPISINPFSHVSLVEGPGQCQKMTIGEHTLIVGRGPNTDSGRPGFYAAITNKPFGRYPSQPVQYNPRNVFDVDPQGKPIDHISQAREESLITDPSRMIEASNKVVLDSKEKKIMEQISKTHYKPPTQPQAQAQAQAPPSQAILTELTNRIHTLEQQMTDAMAQIKTLSQLLDETTQFVVQLVQESNPPK